MNLFTLSWSYIRHRKLSTLLNTLLLALGVGIIIYLLLITNQLQRRMEASAKGINLVIGAKGSPLQLILCNIFHMDNPTGNISLSEAKRITANPMMVKEAIPLSLGDSYEAFRIAGTTQAYPRHYQCQLAVGQWWKAPMDVTLGSEVAQQTGMKLGSTFHSSHGLVEEGSHTHDEKTYRVVGIMQPNGTVLDRLILTSLESVWMVHEEHKENEEHESHEAHEEHSSKESATTDTHAEDKMPIISLNPSTLASSETDTTRQITAMLVTFKNPIAALTLPRLVNSQTALQAASPAVEILRLWDLLGVGADVIHYFAYILVLIAGLSIFIALYNALNERQYDLAIMRTLGASRWKLFVHMLLEGLLLAAMGGICGLVLGHGAVEVTGLLLKDVSQQSLTGKEILSDEGYLVLGVLGVGICAALLPALQTYRMNISDTLAQG